MTTTNTNHACLTSVSKHDAAKKWIQRRLGRVKSRQNVKKQEEEKDEEKEEKEEEQEEQGDGCAPAQTGNPLPPSASPAKISADGKTANPSPPASLTIARDFSPWTQPRPSRVPRTDPGVVRNVNAWLDASMSTSSPPLMGGLTYWRTATVAGAKDASGLQHAIPIGRQARPSVPSLPHGQQGKSIRRRAKKLQVQMPSLLQVKSQRLKSRKQVYRQSASMPLLALSYEATQQGEPPVFMTRCRSLLRPPARPSTANASTRSRGRQSTCTDCLEGKCVQHSHVLDVGLDESSVNTEQRIRALSRSTARLDSVRSPTIATSLTREDSMGNLSDAPTYFTGLPPPSYQSRTTSLLTISSFGCVDGMNAEQRQISQQRAARDRGMRGRLRRLAGNFSS